MFLRRGESPPRKVWNATDKDRIDTDSDDRGEKDGRRIFLRAIMGGFSSPNKGSSGLAKRKIAELRSIHVTSLRGAKKRLLLGFTNNEKVSEVSNEELPLVVIVGIRGHDFTMYSIDKWSSIDILYQDAFEKLGLKRDDLEFYDYTKLHGFKETSMRPWV